MRRFHNTVGAVILFLMILVSACAPRSEPVISEGPPLPATSEETAEPAMTEETTEPAASEEATEPASSDQSAGPQFPDFDPANFENSTDINNKWIPMKPGTFWAYEGTAIDDEGNNIDRRIEFTVTDLTKEIQGVNTVVGWIADFTDGELGEKEIAFYAQDNNGNVWYFGEHPEDYENGQFIEAPTWIAGFQDAKPGIVMMAKPQLGMPNVYQGWGPEVDWSDYGRVEQMGQENCVPVACYKDVLVNAEASLTEPGAFQLKYYAPNVGEIRIGWKGDDPTKEELEMVEYKQLSPDELADVHAQALELEKHAYEVNPDAYGETTPMQ
ncbi:MAG TPA: hypothetical protein VF918_20755 [Anaerolineales bacterium]